MEQFFHNLSDGYLPILYAFGISIHPQIFFCASHALDPIAFSGDCSWRLWRSCRYHLSVWKPPLHIPLQMRLKKSIISCGSYHEVGGHLFVSSIYIVLARLQFQLAVSGGGLDEMSLFHGSSSLDWCAGMAAHERCSQLGNLCKIFAGCSRVEFSSVVLFAAFFLGILALLLAQPTDIPWLRLCDVAPAHNLLGAWNTSIRSPADAINFTLRNEVFSKGDARGNYEGGLGIQTAREAIFRWQQKKFLLGMLEFLQAFATTFSSPVLTYMQLIGNLLDMLCQTKVRSDGSLANLNS
ncbi:hypothetical protein Peur_061926 [Populus x canadensis]